MLLKLPTTRTQGDVLYVNPRFVSCVTQRLKHEGGGSWLYMVTSRIDKPMRLPITMSPEAVREALNV